MTNFLLDTVTVSEFTKTTPDDGVVSWFVSVDPLDMYLSVLTLGEMRYGIELKPPGRQRTDFETWLVALPHQFQGRLLPVSANVADRYGRLVAAARKNGHTPSAIDVLIAATAEDHNLVVATRNEKDFAMLGVPTLNPWT